MIVNQKPTFIKYLYLKTIYWFKSRRFVKWADLRCVVRFVVTIREPLCPCGCRFCKLCGYSMLFEILNIASYVMLQQNANRIKKKTRQWAGDGAALTLVRKSVLPSNKVTSPLFRETLPAVSDTPPPPLQ